MKLQLRNTALGYFTTCPEKFRIGVLLQLQPKQQMKHFDVGTLYHEGLRNYLHPINQSLDLNTRLEVATEAMVVYSKKNQMAQEELNVALGLIRAYFRRFPQEDEFRVISVEQQMSVEIGTEVTYGVTMDFIGETNNKRLAVGEHKSTGYFSANYSNYIKHSPQIMGSCWVARQVLKRPVELAIINYGVKTKEPRAERDRILINDHALDFWYERTLETTDLIRSNIAIRGSEQPWIQNNYACYPFAGNACIYTSLCHHSWPQLALQEFEKRPIGGPTQILS